jgi:mRNA-decapping enzyme 1B
MCHSEFEELEAVPTSAAIDGPLEPPPASTLISDTPDESLANYFSVRFLQIFFEK